MAQGTTCGPTGEAIGAIKRPHALGPERVRGLFGPSARPSNTPLSPGAPRGVELPWWEPRSGQISQQFPCCFACWPYCVVPPWQACTPHICNINWAFSPFCVPKGWHRAPLEHTGGELLGPGSSKSPWPRTRDRFHGAPCAPKSHRASSPSAIEPYHHVTMSPPIPGPAVCAKLLNEHPEKHFPHYPGGRSRCHGAFAFLC